ncbi:CAunnamed protein product [Biomphalaria glabrata]|uniref:Uncharacterized protein n=1 Tax=Biomphalaria glabrata TaxID=6526 RepID=A0A2C9M8N1_BIOGL|nr:CAunnamed protein product [Biomphalaria glabrata]
MTTNQHVSSAFEVKMNELDLLKSQFSKHLRSLNGLKFQYMDWFNRRHKHFGELLTLVHMKLPCIMPSRFDCIAHFQKCHDCLSKVSKTRLPTDKCLAAMNELLQFWRRLKTLLCQSESLYKRLCEFCASVSRLRDHRVKRLVDELQERLKTEANDCFDFGLIHETRDNLYTYKVALPYQCFHGLLSLTPHLLKTAIDVCYLSSKIHLEKA